ncbi:hypothetical protein niasHT_029529 [Heterodera trifolii]|uniref:Transmembrane protein n=1 Tax=Heterodera trifolii TaxID=157864 RepID=A0ABD2JAX7_9BILA
MPKLSRPKFRHFVSNFETVVSRCVCHILLPLGTPLVQREIRWCLPPPSVSPIASPISRRVSATADAAPCRSAPQGSRVPREWWHPLALLSSTVCHLAAFLGSSENGTFCCFPMPREWHIPFPPLLLCLCTIRSKGKACAVLCCFSFCSSPLPPIASLSPGFIPRPVA